MKKTTEAFEAWWADTGEQSLYALNTTTDDDIKTMAGIAWEAAIRDALAGESNGRTNDTSNEKRDMYSNRDSGLVPVSTKTLADHSGDANEMVAEPVKRPPNCGTGYCSCIECVMEPMRKPLDDNSRDNMMLRMIQQHFPSLPVSSEYTDWGKWLRFANAVFEAGRKDAAPSDYENRSKKMIRRAFIYTTEAWYAKTLDLSSYEEIMVGDYDPDGSTGGQFAIRWHCLGRGLIPRIEAFHDSFSILLQCADLIESVYLLGDTKSSPKKVCEILKSLGFEDDTQRIKKL